MDLINEIFLQFFNVVGAALPFAVFTLALLHSVFFTVIDFWI